MCIIKLTSFKTNFLLIVCFIFFLSSGYCQQNNIQFESIQEGLSQSNVTCILQDKYGFMWFGTRNGLNLYDGYNFKIYEFDNKDKSSISNNWIASILEDTHGNIWIGTYGGGLNMFNRATEKFKRYRFDENDSLSLSNDNVASVFEDSKKRIWVATAKGLNCYVSESDNFLRFSTETSTLKHDNFSIVFEDKQKNLWLGTQNNGLILFDPEKDKVLKILKSHHSELQGISGNKIRSAILDRNGNVWIGTANEGLNKMEISASGEVSFKRFFHIKNDLKSLSHNSVISLCEDRSGNIWVGTENGGLNKFNVKTQLFEHYKYDATDGNSISSNSIWSIYEDDAGILWMGTYNKGISKLDKRRFKFRHYEHSTLNKNSLNQNAVNAFIEDDNGKIWIGTDGGGLNYFDPKTSNFEHFKHQANNPKSLGSNAVIDVYRDSKDRLWVATWAGGINVLENINKPENKFLHFRQGEHFFNIIEDSDQSFWLASWESGLIHIDESFNILDVYSSLEENPSNQISAINVFGLMLDDKDRLWVATLNGLNLGVKQANGKYKFQKFLHDENDSSSIRSNVTYFAYQDSNKNIWIGTNSGLSVFQEQTNSFKSYTKNDGLPDVDIKSIIEDDEGSFWVGTSRGLSKVENLNTKKIINYKPGDGLQGSEFNRGAIYKTSNGKILVGGNNGFNYFSLDEIRDNTLLPKVYLTNFKIFNEEVPINTQESPLKQSVILTNEITLSYKETVFSFDFVGLNYTHPDRNQYAYKLEGLEKSWNYVKSQRSASYSNLDAGKYTFWVKASNNDGVWNESPLKLVVNVTPPWWEIWWVKAIFGFLFLGAVYVFYKTRTNILKAQKRKLEYKVEERTAEIRSANKSLQEQKDEITVQNEELSQQSEEILAQRDKIEENHQKLAAAYKDIKVVSEIGKDITSTFSVEAIVKVIYNNVCGLMPSDNFAIALFNPIHNSLDFFGIESGNSNKIVSGTDLLSSDNNLSVLCFKNLKEIFINDYNIELSNYLKEPSTFHSGCNAMIYLPLIAEQKKMGIITVQSNHKHAYEERHLTLLQTLATYIAIALDNANAYKVINDKNEMITDSIRYAHTIQQAILPSDKWLNSIFEDHFTLYYPKDIVSGDFYWLAENKEEGKFFLAVADCTGHGVPGAFMSMIGSRILDEIIYEKRIYNPCEILKCLNKEIIRALNQDAQSEDSNTDGLDIALCVFDKKDDQDIQLTFSGAKSTIFIMQEDKFRVVKGDKKYIGGKSKSSQSHKIDFSNTKIKLNKGDKIYLSTDGIIDQCDPDRKRFGSPRLKNFVKNHHKSPFNEQKVSLAKELEIFQKEAKQRDDITFMGILI